MADEGQVLKITKLEEANVSFYYQTDNGRIYYIDTSSSTHHRIFVKLNWREIDALLPGPIACLMAHYSENAIYFRSEEKVYKAAYHDYDSEGFKVSFVRDKYEEEEFQAYGMCSRVENDKILVYHICDKPSEEVLLDVPEDLLKGLVLRTVHSGKAIYLSRNPSTCTTTACLYTCVCAKPSPTIRKLGENVLVIQASYENRGIILYANDSSPFIYFSPGDNHIIVIDTETLTFLTTLKFDGDKVLRIVGVNRGKIAAEIFNGERCYLVSAQLPIDCFKFCDQSDAQIDDLTIQDDQIFDHSTYKEKLDRLSDWVRQKENLLSSVQWSNGQDDYRPLFEGWEKTYNRYIINLTTLGDALKLEHPDSRNSVENGCNMVLDMWSGLSGKMDEYRNYMDDSEIRRYMHAVDGMMKLIQEKATSMTIFDYGTDLPSVNELIREQKTLEYEMDDINQKLIQYKSFGEQLKTKLEPADELLITFALRKMDEKWNELNSYRDKKNQVLEKSREHFESNKKIGEENANDQEFSELTSEQVEKNAQSSMDQIIELQLKQIGKLSLKNPHILEKEDEILTDSIQQEPIKFSSRFESEFSIKQILGAGAFGIVFEVVHNLDEWKYAVKRIAIMPNEENITLQEVRTMAKCVHPGIVRYNYTWIEKPPVAWQFESDGKMLKDIGPSRIHYRMNFPVDSAFIYIQMELCKYSLAEWLNANREQSTRSITRIKSWIKQIVSAVAYIHKENIIHRDLKPANILFFDEDTLKLCDLGITTVRIFEDGETAATRTSIGTPKYMSPEQKSLFAKYSSKADVFALGLIMAELYMWKPSIELELIFDNYRAGKQSDHIEDAQTAEFVNLLTQEDQAIRPSCEDILKHSYLA